MEKLEQQIIHQVKDALAGAIKSTLEGYGSPLKKLVEEAIGNHQPLVKDMINKAIGGILYNDEFRTQMIHAIQHKVARELTNSFGEGIFKKTIDQLKSDPMIRARCVTAIEGILNEAMNQGMKSK